MKRSKHSLSHYRLLSGNMGQILPIGVVEALPGDTFQHATSALFRMQPLLAPVMHPVHLKIHHWFVPHRLVWEDWEDFVTGGPDGNDASVFPTITLGTNDNDIGSLADYLGVPTDVDNLEVSALPFRAYQLIFNEWYRDQDLVTERTIDTTSGADSTTDITLATSAWEKDYFTSARPWEQKGNDITVPLGDTAPVVSTGDKFELSGTGYTDQRVRVSSGSPSYLVSQGTGSGGADWAHFGSETGLEADLSNATGLTVNQLREAMALQRYQEARARYGSRYTEYLRYLGVKSSDARLQRPEYLGGGKTTVQFSEVLQTAEGTNPVATMRGHGISAVRSNRYRRFFEEHGYVISVAIVRPKAIYQDGLPRHWNRRTKEDFWQRELQHIGQQPVLNKEVYAAHTTPDGTFGYQDRYDEYRRLWSGVSGEFRDTLDFWHMARQFGADPSLNSAFVNCDPTTRIYPATDADQFYIMANHSIQARRLVSKQGTSYIA